MLALQLQDSPLMEAWSETDETRRLRFGFPVSSLEGAAASAVVYFELEPGARTGVHTDSAEETLVLLEGTVEAVVGEERGEVATGGVALVPALVPHDVRNVGAETARVVGFFASSTVVSVFEDAFLPVGRTVVGTPLPEDPAVAA